MGLVIHDLKAEEWKRISGEYRGWQVVTDNGTIKPCVGCFRCWHKTPGECVIRDGYEDMGALIHSADEAVVISRYTFGGFSGFVKNVFDRSLGYILPQFEVINNETHHKKRYAEDKPFTFIFYGHSLNEGEKESARRYVTAVCANIRGHVKDVIFRENGEKKADSAGAPGSSGTSVPSGSPGKVLLLNGSMRFERGNSTKFAKQLASQLKKESELIALKDYPGHFEDLLPAVENAGEIVLCVPLYVDGLPAQVIRFMEWMQDHYCGRPRKIYVLANMGLYESCQLVNLFEAVRQWCAAMNFEYCGGLGVSAGELIGTMMTNMPFNGWPFKTIAAGMDRLAQAVGSGGAMEDVYTEPSGFPRFLYILIANKNWDNLARRNGLRPKDLYRQL